LTIVFETFPALENPMKKTLALALLSFCAAAAFASPAPASAPAAGKVDISMWKNVKQCSAPGKVVSAAADKKNGAVAVKTKLTKGGKLFTSTVPGTTDAKLFAKGSDFCAVDYSGD
jgi:hypothetical protein